MILNPELNNQIETGALKSRENLSNTDIKILKIVEEIQKSNGIINGVKNFISKGGTPEKISDWENTIAEERAHLELLTKQKQELLDFKYIINSDTTNTTETDTSRTITEENPFANDPNVARIEKRSGL